MEIKKVYRTSKGTFWSKEEVPKNIKNFWPAHCMLLIWNPDLMNFWPPGSNVRRYQRLNYRARGIVLHDRELNQ